MTTEVEFHTGVADSIDFVCRLLRKAHRKGARVLVTAPAPLLSELDAALWAFDAQDFVPHLRLAPAASAGSGSAAERADLAARTPIWLAESEAASASLSGAPRVVVNVGAAPPTQPAALERLIEVVGAETEAAEQGRGRWRDYRAAGLRIKHHAAAAAADRDPL